MEFTFVFRLNLSFFRLNFCLISSFHSLPHHDACDVMRHDAIKSSFTSLERGSPSVPLSLDLHLTFTWPSPDLHLTFTWPSPDLHLTFTWPSHDLHMTFTCLLTVFPLACESPSCHIIRNFFSVQTVLSLISAKTHHHCSFSKPVAIVWRASWNRYSKWIRETGEFQDQADTK
jgi:hypothetical protein